jgi:GntR family transcriptional repressor for pyruvate dehydrogenase complex
MNKKKFSMVPIKRTDVFQEATSRIEALIVQGRMQPGDRLPSEREIAESLGVSRTSVRQAIKVLEASHLVECRIGSGTYVADPKSRDRDGFSNMLPAIVDTIFLNQLIAARSGIERAIFKECCLSIDAQGIDNLRNLLEENARDFVENDLDDGGGLDLSFESKVAELTGNAILFQMQEKIHQLWVLAWSRYGSEPEKKILLHNEHIAMLDALEHRDCELILSLIEQHVDKEIS